MNFMFFKVAWIFVHIKSSISIFVAVVNGVQKGFLRSSEGIFACRVWNSQESIRLRGPKEFSCVGVQR